LGQDIPHLANAGVEEYPRSYFVYNSQKCTDPGNSMSDTDYIFISRAMPNTSLVRKYIFPLASNKITSNDVFDELHILSTTTADLF